MDRSHGGRSRTDIQPCGQNVLNDIPANAKSCHVYEVDVLRTFCGEDTYPISQREEFQQLRKLRSLQAVVKEISPGKSVFSHMLISPKDVFAIFGNDFMEEMKPFRETHVTLVFVR